MGRAVVLWAVRIGRKDKGSGREDGEGGWKCRGELKEVKGRSMGTNHGTVQFMAVDYLKCGTGLNNFEIVFYLLMENLNVELLYVIV